MDLKKLYQKQSDPIKLLIIVIVIIVFLYFLKQAKTFFNTPLVNMNNIPSVGQTPSGNIIQWNPDPLAAEIAQKLEGYNFNTYPEVAQKVLDLQTDDLEFLLIL
ncbi:hypothetical protein DXU93_03265 [Brumimicrobium aurantiacum]|uniref:Uncharacterized protein n=1 Tax=Brumimicrobium aurantiacum TaxID=1737063 RepID=A0A3E1EZE3_9FLAO|nr:hypothetical protein DXU93_03265 [Brumimicrobium aurantiacum]